MMTGDPAASVAMCQALGYADLTHSLPAPHIVPYKGDRASYVTQGPVQNEKVGPWFQCC